jgi:hypothetical protein
MVKHRGCQVPNPLWFILGDCIMVLGWSLAWVCIADGRFNLIESAACWFIGAVMSALSSRMLLHTALTYLPCHD